jgi:hypothetical protein
MFAILHGPWPVSRTAAAQAASAINGKHTHEASRGN